MKICFSNSRGAKIADNFFSFPMIIKIGVRIYCYMRSLCVFVKGEGILRSSIY